MNFLDQVTVQLVRETCYRCSVVFAMPEDLKKRCLQNRAREFYCPNGHGQHYLGKSKEQQAREEAEQARANAAWWQQRARSNAEDAARAKASQRVTKGHLTRIRNRVAAGVCPCCRRNFKDLHRHMAGKHPEFGKANP